MAGLQGPPLRRSGLADDDLVDQSEAEDSFRHLERGLEDQLLGVVGSAMAVKNDRSVDAIDAEVVDPPTGGAFDVALEALGEVVQWWGEVNFWDQSGKLGSSHVVVP